MMCIRRCMYVFNRQAHATGPSPPTRHSHCGAGRGGKEAQAGRTQGYRVPVRRLRASTHTERHGQTSVCMPLTGIQMCDALRNTPHISSPGDESIGQSPYSPSHDYPSPPGACVGRGESPPCANPCSELRRLRCGSTSLARLPSTSPRRASPVNSACE